MVAVILVFIIFNIFLLYIFRKSRFYGYTQLTRNQIVKVLLILVGLSIIGLQSGDYWGYKEHVEEAYSILKNSTNYDGYLTHMETQYSYLAYYLGGNYILWRFVVYGLQYFLLFWLLKKIKYLDYNFLYLYFILAFTNSIVGRSSWGHMLLVCMMILSNYTSNFFYRALSFLSVFSHKFLIVPLFISFSSFFKFNNKKLLLSLFLIPLLSYYIGIIFADLLILDDFQEGLSRSVSYYVDDLTSTNIWGNSIGEILSYFPLRISLLCIVAISIYQTIIQKKNIENHIQGLVPYIYILSIFAIVFAVKKIGDATFAIRFFDAMCLPATFVLYSLRRNGRISEKVLKFLHSLILISFESSFLRLIYYSI